MQCNAPPKNEQELLDRCYRIAGQSLQELAKAYQQNLPKSLGKAKGFIGNLLEWHLGAPQNNLPEPDFINLGIELKTIPINHQGQPKESTYLCTVSEVQALARESWHSSRVYQKLKRILWIPIEADPKIPIGKRKVGLPILWSLTKGLEEIVKKDWEELTEMILFGQQDQLTAHLGTYLQIRPKALNSRVVQKSFDEAGEITVMNPRGFYLRCLFTKKVLESL